MVSCCSVSSPFPNVKDYLPTRREVKSTIYGLFASIISSAIVYNIGRSLVSGCGLLMSFICTKLVDYIGDAFIKGKVSDQMLNIIKTAIKIAGMLLAAALSLFVFKFAVAPMIASMGIYFILNTYLQACDPVLLSAYF